MLKIRSNPYLYVGRIAHPTVIENGARYQACDRKAALLPSCILIQVAS